MENQLIRHFCIVGIKNKFKPFDRIQKNSLTSLELHEYVNQTFNNQEKWIQLASNLWLRAKFNEPNKKSITNIKKVAVDLNNKQIVFSSSSYVPIKIITNSFDTYQDYVLNDYLKEQNEEPVIMCYTTKEHYLPIIDLELKPFLAVDQEYIYNEKMLSLIRKEDPLKQAYKSYILDLYPFQYRISQKAKYQNPMNHSKLLSKLCFPEGIYFQSFFENFQTNYTLYMQVLRDQQGNNFYIYCLRFYEIFQYEYLFPTQEQELLVPKTICIISNYLFSQQFFTLLEKIYSIYITNEQIQLEFYIENLIRQLTINSQLVFSINQKITFCLGEPFPHCTPIAINYLFDHLDVESIIKLYTCLVLERRIILVSNDIQSPGYVIEALNILLYPFEFMKICIPYLPQDMIEYLESPEPFIIGYRKNFKNAPKRDGDTIEVNLDTSTIDNVNPLPLLPEKLRVNLYKQLARFSNQRTIRKQLNDNDVSEIRNAFFRVNLKLLEGIDDYYVGHKFQIKKFEANKQGFLSRLFDNTKSNNVLYAQESFWNRLPYTSLFMFFVDQRKVDSQNQKYVYVDKCLKTKNKKKRDFFPPTQLNISKIIEEKQLIQRNHVCYYSQFPILTAYSQLKSKSQWANMIKLTIYQLWYKYLFIILNFLENEQIKLLLEYAIMIVLDKCHSLQLDNLIYYQLYAISQQFYNNQNGQNIQKQLLKYCPNLQIYQYYQEFVSNDGPQQQYNKINDVEDIQFLQFNFNNKCQCGRKLSIEEILSKMSKYYFGSSLIKCSQKQGGCNKKIQVKFEIVNFNLSIQLLNPLILQRELEYYEIQQDYLISQNFKLENDFLFWNIVFYFKLLQLPILLTSINQELQGIQQDLNGKQREDESSSSSGSYQQMKQELGDQELRRAFKRQLSYMQKSKGPQTNQIQIDSQDNSNRKQM